MTYFWGIDCIIYLCHLTSGINKPGARFPPLLVAYGLKQSSTLNTAISVYRGILWGFCNFFITIASLTYKSSYYWHCSHSIRSRFIKRSSVLHMSVCPIDQRVCCWSPRGHEISTDSRRRRSAATAPQQVRAWASTTHSGKWGQLIPLENGWKIEKRKLHKEQFSEYFESNQGRQV